MLFGRAMSSDGQVKAVWALYRQLPDAGDQAGELFYIGQDKGFTLIKDLTVWDAVNRTVRVIGDLSR